MKHEANCEGKLQVLMCKCSQGAGPKSSTAGAFPQHCKLQTVQEQPNETSHWDAWAGVAGIASADTMGIQDEQCKLELGVTTEALKKLLLVDMLVCFFGFLS